MPVSCWKPGQAQNWSHAAWLVGARRRSSEIATGTRSHENAQYERGVRPRRVRLIAPPTEHVYILLLRHAQSRARWRLPTQRPVPRLPDHLLRRLGAAAPTDQARTAARRSLGVPRCPDPPRNIERGGRRETYGAMPHSRRESVVLRREPDLRWPGCWRPSETAILVTEGENGLSANVAGPPFRSVAERLISAFEPRI